MASELERDKFGIRGEGVTHQGAPSSGQQGTGPFAETVAKSPRWGKAKLVRDCLAVWVVQVVAGETCFSLRSAWTLETGIHVWEEVKEREEFRQEDKTKFWRNVLSAFCFGTSTWGPNMAYIFSPLLPASVRAISGRRNHKLELSCHLLEHKRVFSNSLRL